MNRIRAFIRIVSSKEFLLWLIGGWIVYYVTLAVWSKEAFATFVVSLDNNLLVQVLFIVFLLSAVLNLIRAGVSRYKRGRWAVAFWVLLPLGVFVFMLGFFISVNFRQMEQSLVGEGDIVKTRWQEKVYTVRQIESALKEELFYIDSDTGIFQYEPRIVLDDGKERFEVGVFPPKKIHGTYYHILNFGLAPGVRLSQGEKVLSEGYMALRILPPGAEDSFEIPFYPYRFSVRIVPEKTVEKGTVKAKTYNLKSPLYEVTVRKGEDILFAGVSTDGVEFDGFTLSFFEPTYWVLLETAKNPGLAVMVSGIFLIAAGVPLRMLLIIYKIIKRQR
jgi:hypothetical protein